MRQPPASASHNHPDITALVDGIKHQLTYWPVTMLRCYRWLPWKGLLACLTCRLVTCDSTACDRPKRWDEHLERPHLDYSEIFEEDVGQIPGKCLLFAAAVLVVHVLCFLFGAGVLRFYLLLIVCLECCFLFYMGCWSHISVSYVFSNFCSRQNSWWLMTPDDGMHLPE